jgi:hypothetical protein
MITIPTHRMKTMTRKFLADGLERLLHPGGCELMDGGCELAASYT